MTAEEPAAEAGILEELVQTGGRLFLFVLDGLGGLPHPRTGLTELETARTPHLDELAKAASLGLLRPVAPGVTPGSAPAHLALFGYDPLEYRIGRGVLSAVGTGVNMGPGDVAVRVNFCTVEEGKVVDRRAGRMPTEITARLCDLLNAKIQLPGVQVEIHPEMQYRAVMVMRGEGLDPRIGDTDPQREGLAPLPVKALVPEAERTAALVAQVVEQAQEILAGERPANAILLRGFGSLPRIPTLQERFGLNPAVIAVYPMYRGLAQLVGMTPLPTGPTLAEQVAAFAARPDDFDYVFFHLKDTDAAGEDGDFDRKVAVIEAFDAHLPQLLTGVDLARDVVVVTGDHSTPAIMRSHSWHPVPVLLASAHSRRSAFTEGFGETSCARGNLGCQSSQDLMALMLAHAGRLRKFGA